MINIINLSIQYTGKSLFDNVSFAIKPDDRIGLIGRNGTGKSTLLKIIYGLEVPENGRVSHPKDHTLGYLPQDEVSNSKRTVHEESSKSLAELQSLERNIQSITQEISKREDYESKEYTDLVVELSESNERFEFLGGHSIDSEIDKVLIGLGFSQNDFDRPVNEFSGGWQMRIELAKILLSHPDTILLDEPTNHLDIESIQWLEGFLKTYKGSLMIVSHDRSFLDAVTNRTIEISLGKLYDYNLPYSKFIIQRMEIQKQQEGAFKNQQRQIAQTERFIERFRSKATLATRVQSRIKMLDKIDRVEIELEDVSAIKFKFPNAIRPARTVIEVSEMTKSYGDNLVLDSINFAVERNDKIAFVGKNGEGKTTLSRIIAGDEVYEGIVKLGTNVDLGYYAQHQAELLDANATVFDIIDQAAIGEMRAQIRYLLGAFLFSGDSVYKKVKVLSGGEKSRLAIARLLLQPINLLILDEPTNHLDMVAKDVLKDALLNYKGALIIVSHDRSFLHGLTQKTVYFKDKKIKEYTGDIFEFIEKQKIESLKELELSIPKKGFQNNHKIKFDKSKNQIDRELRKQIQRDENRIKKAIYNCERKIENLELEIAEYEKLFSNPDFFIDINKSKQKQKKYDELRKLLNKKIDEWTELQTNLETLS